MRHRVVPTKAERWQQLINRICLRSRKQNGNNARRKNSAYCSTVPIKGAVRLPVRYLRVRRPHFDRHPSGTLEAGKLRAPVNSVKSRVAPWRCESADCSAAARGPPVTNNFPGEISSRDPFLFFLGHARFFFLVKKIFGRDENKISNKVHFFLVDFESDFYSQARWRGKQERM